MLRNGRVPDHLAWMDLCRYMGWGWRDYVAWIESVPAQMVDDVKLRISKANALAREGR